MRIPLTRIEYDFILETFIEIQPPLFVQCSGVLYTIASNDYQFIRSRICFPPLPHLQGNMVTVFFSHKGRTLCFDTLVLRNNNSDFFMFPDTLYKYNTQRRSGHSIYADIYSGRKRLTAAYEHSQFPIDAIMDTAISVNDIKAAVLTDQFASIQRKLLLLQPETIPLFWYRIHDFEKETALFFNLHNTTDSIFLFIDNKYIVCGCKPSVAKEIEQFDTFRFAIHFSVRTVFSEKGKLIESYKLAEKNSTIIIFALDYAFEEDKRFLYELTYHLKYNPSYLLQRGG